MPNAKASLAPRSAQQKVSNRQISVLLSDNFQFALEPHLSDSTNMSIKDSEVYPKYTFRLSHEDKEWLDNELEFLKIKFNAGNDGSFPVIPKNILLMSALKRGLRYLRERVHSRCIQKDLLLNVGPQQVWKMLTDPNRLAMWWQPGMILEPHVGGRFVEPWKGSDGSDQLASGTVVEVIPKEFIQFTWREKTWAEREETVCSFHLLPIGDSQTRILLMHSGWEIFPAENVDKMKKAFETGWDSLLEKLSTVQHS